MAEDLYELIRERYERKALILTSNRALAEWPDAFANNLLASAALDRLTHHCHVGGPVLAGKTGRRVGQHRPGGAIVGTGVSEAGLGEAVGGIVQQAFLLPTVAGVTVFVAALLLPKTSLRTTHHGAAGASAAMLGPPIA